MVAFTDASIDESSSAAMSYAVPTAFWTCNDENTSPHAFLVDTVTGNTIGSFSWSDSSGITDPEAICVDNQGRLWWADIGDNDRKRSNISIFMCPDPGAGSHGTLSGERYYFKYDDGTKWNAECLLIHPVSQLRFIVSKKSSGAALWQIPTTLQGGGVRNPLTRAWPVMPANVSDGCFSLDGRWVFWRCEGANTTVYVWNASTWQPAGEITVPSQTKPEGITMAWDGLSLWITSEGVNAPFYNVALPEAYWPIPGFAGPTPTNPCG